jgi:hypothetical protein
LKIIDKIEIEYVVPETPEELAEIRKLIADVEAEKMEQIDYSKLKIIDNQKMPEGFWRKK